MNYNDSIELHPELRPLSEDSSYMDILIESVSAEAEHREAMQRKLLASSSEDNDHDARVLGSVFGR